MVCRSPKSMRACAEFECGGGLLQQAFLEKEGVGVFLSLALREFVLRRDALFLMKCDVLRETLAITSVTWCLSAVAMKGGEEFGFCDSRKIELRREATDTQIMRTTRTDE